MINFDKDVVIEPPPYSDSTGNVIFPEKIILQKLDIIFIDDTKLKQIFAQVHNLPIYIPLWLSDEYDQVGDWTREQAKNRILNFLGDNPSKAIRSLYPKTLEETPNHPGTVLSKMIKAIGIQMNDNCSCKKRALRMNEMGNNWCEENIDLIVSWLREESKNRGLPFIDAIGKLLVSRAIKKSRKLLANEPVPENDDDLDSM